jgi:hypothetical protein
MLGAICATALFAGCSKPAQTSAPTPENNAAQPAAESPSAQPTPVDSSPAPSPAPAAITNSAGPDLVPLNQALLDWRLQNHRVPANFEEFAASPGITIPPPPAGKKYVINSRGLISLVNAK